MISRQDAEVLTAKKTAQRETVKAAAAQSLSCDAVRFIEIDASAEGQRLDNFLLKIAKGVPKSHIYRVIRSGEVRLNKGRTDEKARLALGDIVRVPPLKTAQRTGDVKTAPVIREAELPVLFEDEHLLVVNKPSGLAAHGGSGVAFGLIERLRASRPAAPFLELAHRLDRDTSGALIVCKTRKALVRLHEMQREGKVEKHYRLLVQGDWVNDRQHVKAPLARYVLPSGERRVKVDEVEGLSAHTIFTLIERFGDVSFLDAELKTGRTHQIRVHALSTGHPLVGDDKYGDYAFNDDVKKGSLGVRFARLFLHAMRLQFIHPVTGSPVTITAPLPAECEALLAALRARGRVKDAK
ncbi:RluA family pseudouridine synthase [Duodenibacillus massiliensis]|uniref:RluA family pseudouridine synthase n=1 Tax=Duodenibacillus massiliensis TaxID=1852381 RepID=UPI0003408A9A|nr:RluA family pseudouridine synthase [uncultured Duodenibacillus sp.]CDD69931.1 pseudouridine synthase [Sutterella sp. CAG:397]